MRARWLLIAVAVAWPLCVQAQSLAAAETFVRGLYQGYANDGDPDYLGRQASQVFSPRLLRLIRRDERLTPKGDVPDYLDGDPICDCQDSGGLGDVKVEVVSTGAGYAQAKVRFRISDDRRTLTLDLVSVRGQWRVDDVHGSDMPSLAHALLEAHPRRRRG